MSKILNYKQRKALEGKLADNYAVNPEEEFNLYKSKFKEYSNKDFVYPDIFEGKGIVICGGGLRYFTCAYVCLEMLRLVGCTLPVEIWALGPHEFDSNMEKLIEPLDAKFVNALEFIDKDPTPHLHGWSLKSYAIMNCPFKEVLFLDADNFPVQNPEKLFEYDDYKKTGSIFWPDYTRLSSDRNIWSICEVPYNDEPEFETGQIVVDKSKCWKELKITNWMNVHSDFFYDFIWGDKETFHMAWRKTNKRYTMVGTPIKKLPKDGSSMVMCQHDLNGEVIFQHRNIRKWSLSDGNPVIPGFMYEDLGFKFLVKLGKSWRHKIEVDNSVKVDTIKSLVSNVGRFRVRVNDKNQNYFVTLKPDGCMNSNVPIYNGSWNVDILDQTPVLVVNAKNKVSTKLKQNRDGKWIGFWNTPKKDKVTFIPSPTP